MLARHFPSRYTRQLQSPAPRWDAEVYTVSNFLSVQRETIPSRRLLISRS